MKIKISADSTCDLPAELIEKYNIGIMPLSIVKNGTPLRDGFEIVPQDIFDHVTAGGDLPTTTAVNAAEYISVFSEYRKEYDAVVHFTISGEMSACYQNAVIAAAEVPGVYPIDARNLSTGIGHLVLDAAIMAADGMDAADIKAQLDEKKNKLDVSFVVDTLEFLRKGGRCSAIAALGANLLSLHPCIEVRDGKMGVGKKYRGSIEKCLTKYIEERLSGRDDIDRSRIFITNSGGFSQETLDKVKALVNEYGPFDEVLESYAGCTVSCHCGPKTLGVLFYKK